MEQSETGRVPLGLLNRGAEATPVLELRQFPGVVCFCALVHISGLLCLLSRTRA